MGLFGKLFGKKVEAPVVQVKVQSENVSSDKISNQLDYDTHLKPATAIKKEKGEDSAIDYLFVLYESKTWSIDDRFSILSKCGEYLKKANDSNKLKIISNYQNLLADHKHYNGAQALSKIYLDEKKYEEAFQMISLAGSSIDPNANTYFLDISNNSAKAANILAKKGLSNRKVSIDFIYYSLHRWFFHLAWNIIVDEEWNTSQLAAAESLKEINEDHVVSIRNSISDLKQNLKPEFPFDDKRVKESLLLINQSSDIESNAKIIQDLLFERFPPMINDLKHQSGAVPIINEMINSYLDDL